MARYRVVDTNPQFLSVDLARQLLPGTFEHALNHLLGHEVDLARFDARFKNDAAGAPAYPPAMLLKVVLFAYSQGIVRRRAIERVCQEAGRGKPVRYQTYAAPTMSGGSSRLFDMAVPRRVSLRTTSVSSNRRYPARLRRGGMSAVTWST